MLNTKKIISDLNKLPNDCDRVNQICDKPSFGNKPSLIHAFVYAQPQDIPKLLQTLSDLEERATVMKLDKEPFNRPIDCLDEEYVPAVLTCLRAKDRLDYIRREDSGATEYGKSSNAKFKYINFVIYCDLYLEHLEASLLSHPTHSPELTEAKIKAIEDARAILLNYGSKLQQVPQAFYEHLLDNQVLLAKRRDTSLTTFLRSIGLEFVVNYAYSSLFVKTDGQALFEKIEAIEKQAHMSNG